MLRAVSRRLFGTVYVESGTTQVVRYRGTSSAQPSADIVGAYPTSTELRIYHDPYHSLMLSDTKIGDTSEFKLVVSQTTLTVYPRVP